MIVDQLFTTKIVREGEVYDLGREYGAPEPARKPRSYSSSPGSTSSYRHPEDTDFMDPIERRLRKEEERIRQAWAADKAKKGMAEGSQRKLDESLLMEDPVYRDFKRVGRFIAEQKLTEPEILKVFADAEAGMTDKATGANRTFLGRGKDATVDFAKDVAGAVKGVLNSIQNSVPVSAVDVAYDQATDALANVTGGQKGAVMTAIKKYRNLVKQYPKTAGFAKAALVAIAGLATGGAGLPAIAGLTYALDSAIKGDKLSSVIGKGAGAAALAAAAQAIHGGATQTGPANTNAFTNVNQMGDHTGEYVDMPDGTTNVVSPLIDPTPDLATYTVQSGDTLSQIAEKFHTSVQELVGLNPQLASASGATGGQGLNPDVIFPGQQITLPPGADGISPYAGGMGTSANTMADIARGQIPDSPISQAMAAKGQAAADTATSTAAASTPTSSLNIDPSTNSGTVTLPSGETMKASVFPEGGSLQPRLPVGLETIQVPYNGQQVTGYIGNGIVYFPNFPAAQIKESVKYRARILPADRLIDQRATVLAWALNESVGRSSKSVNLTTLGTYTVFENIDRYRKAILEATTPGRPELPDQYRPDMPGGAGVQSKPGLIGRGLNWLDKAAGKVGGALSNFGHQFTTNVTKEKLKMNWHQAGKPSDSDQLAAWLVTQGVPQEVVTSVYGKMGIPYTAPATAPASAEPGAQPQGTGELLSYSVNPETGEQYTVDQLNKKFAPATTATTAPAATKFPGEDPNGPGYVGRREVARRQAARDAKAAKKPAAPNFAQQNAGYGKVNYAPNIKTGINLPTTTAKPAAPASTQVTTGGPTPAEKAQLDKRIAQALAKPVAEMLSMVETKDDIKQIKKFVEDTFVKYNAINENAFAVRNKIIEHIVQVGAERRRLHAASFN